MRTYRWFVSSVAVGALIPISSMGQSINGVDCTLVNGVLPAECVQPNAGTVVSMPRGENTELEQFDDELGDEGFSISIDTVTPGDDPVTLAGAERKRRTDLRKVDRILERSNVEVRFDGLDASPVLSVATSDLRRSYMSGDEVRFRSASNYSAYVSRAEVRIADARNPDKPIAVLPVDANGEVAWPMPSDAPSKMLYSLRVYDAKGRYDETHVVPLERSNRRFKRAELDGPVIAAKETEDMARRRTIPVSGGAITVHSTGLAPGTSVIVMGERVPVDQRGAFVVQRIMPAGDHTVRVKIGGKTIERSVEVPKDDVFYFATADITVGRDLVDDETYTIGRVAGFIKGRNANGWKYTAAIDTGEDDLDRIFRDLHVNEPRSMIESIRSEDVFATFGDDSTIIDEAPTSGKIYLKAEKNGSYGMVGDFKTSSDRTSLVRSDRTLFGLRGEYVSPNQTSFGEPVARVSAFAANPDRLTERNVFEATGGSTYFLRRQGVLQGTSTVSVQLRDPVSGRIVQTRNLTEGEDYVLRHFQGMIQLTQPLSPSSGDTLLSDSTLGRYDVELVVQYEYVPTLGNVDGHSLGAEGEVWLNDRVRFGVIAQSETTGTADSKLVGADLLWRHSALTYAELSYAQSEGPGFGYYRSRNGGFDFDSLTTEGAVGQKAEAYSFNIRADLSELTSDSLAGSFAAYYDYKEAGFVSADYNIANTQTAYGVNADVEINDVSSIYLSFDHYDDDTGKEQEDLRVSYSHAFNEQWVGEILGRYTKQSGGVLNGSRTDLAVRVTYTPHDDFSAWVYAQNTVKLSGNLPENDRYGIGARTRVSERVTIEGEISDGSLGSGGYAQVNYAKDDQTSLHFGYRLDPYRSLDDAGFAGDDGGVWVLGGETRLSDDVTLTMDNTYDRYGNRPSLATTYGVRYTPTERWAFDGGIIYGEKDDPLTGVFKRKGFSFGVHYSDADRLAAGLSGEFHRETSAGDPTLDRKTWGLRGYARYKATEELRILSRIDAIISESDQSSFRDGRYIEGTVGLAYRPINNDRFNALMSFTYLEDLPGNDQVNLEGDLDGPRQKSKILNVDVSYDLNRQFTLGAKYGYRKASVETTRGSGSFTSNTAHLGVLRLDYHVTHQWDATLDVRAMKFKETGVTETGGVIGIWRHFGNNVKAGIGYQVGDVDDDLRRIRGRKEGVFFNIIAKF